MLFGLKPIHVKPAVYCSRKVHCYNIELYLTIIFVTIAIFLYLQDNNDILCKNIFGSRNRIKELKTKFIAVNLNARVRIWNSEHVTNETFFLLSIYVDFSRTQASSHFSQITVEIEQRRSDAGVFDGQDYTLLGNL